MGWPIPGVAVGTPYGRRGSHWGCNKDSAGRGVHTGDDFPAPAGTKVFAPVAGDIRWRNYGPAFGEHQFAISPDADEPFGKGEIFFAHMRKRLPDGTRVKVGQYIGEVGTEGNVTGPHLHAEYHPTVKGAWNCSVHADPAPVWRHNPTGGSSVADSKYTANIYSSKLGYRRAHQRRRVQRLGQGTAVPAEDPGHRQVRRPHRRRGAEVATGGLQGQAGHGAEVLPRTRAA